MVAAAKAPTPAAGAQAAQILSANANYVPGHHCFGFQADQQGKAEDAGKLYERALAVYPTFVPAARNLTVLYAQHSIDDQKAYDLGTKIRQSLPRRQGAWARGGCAGLSAWRLCQAAQLLDQYSQTLTNDGELFYYLGMAQYQLKHMPQSKAALQRALALKIQGKPADDARKVLAELK